MEKDYLNYAKLIDEAMHYVVRRSLELVSENGLIDDHHFFITFETQHSGVMIAPELQEKYPNEMTIVVQHQFWDLEIEHDRFSIVLSFDNVQQNLTVPFSSLISFADPSVKFGLQFHRESFDEEDEIEANFKEDLEDFKRKEGNSDNVVTLDNFRKK